MVSFTSVLHWIQSIGPLQLHFSCSFEMARLLDYEWVYINVLKRLYLGALAHLSLSGLLLLQGLTVF